MTWSYRAGPPGHIFFMGRHGLTPRTFRPTPERIKKNIKILLLFIFLNILFKVKFILYYNNDIKNQEKNQWT
jgi:hypothetical protein